MRILVANDDGIYSPGIAALARVASRFGEVRVVAPDMERSAWSHAITYARPLDYRRATHLGDIEAYRVNGTPADCVAVGVHNWSEVDVVLSGVNLGANLGNALWHSGTLAAAKQATLLGIRGIAVSTPMPRHRDGGEEAHFASLDQHLEDVRGLLLSSNTARLLNVNLAPDSRGITWTRQAVRHYEHGMVPDTDPMGREHFWFTSTPIEVTEPGTDLWAMERGYTSITPLSLDLTAHPELARLRAEVPLDTPPEDAPGERVDEDA
jgi:5'-nucleotidase